MEKQEFKFLTNNYPELFPMLADMKAADYVILYLREKPHESESIRHRVISEQIISTFTGLALIFELENLDTGEKYNYLYPDIESIEVNNNFSDKMIKYYIECSDREKKFEIQDLIKLSEKGLKLKDSEVNLINKGYKYNLTIKCINK